MFIMLYNAWANNPFLLAVYAFMAVLALAALAIYVWRAYVAPYNDNMLIGQLGQIVIWQPHDKRIKLKDVFWQVQAAANQPPFSVGDWVQVVAQDNLVLTISHIQPTE